MKKLTKEEFIEKAIDVHGNEYDYSLVNYINSRTKIDIVCKEHGIFSQNPRNHIGCKSKCPLCRNKKLSKEFASNTNDFIEKAIKIHGNTYDYSKVDYINTNTNVTIICPIHGEFEQTPANHLNGSNCMKCVKSELGKKYSLLVGDFIKRANEVHKNKYGYNNVIYENHMNKVDIICFKHGIFKQTPNAHLHGQGCPICCESKGEKTIKEFLIENNIEFIRQKKFKECCDKMQLPFDFYLPKYNLLIEYDGEQHQKIIKHYGGKNGLVERKKRDMIKNKFAINNKIYLLRLPYMLLENNEIIPTLKHTLNLC
jgi:predicted nucleic-acid-binding Zn-ribbon protein